MQVLEKDDIMKRFQEVTTCLEQALGGIHYDRLDISDEVKEQVGFIIKVFHGNLITQEHNNMCSLLDGNIRSIIYNMTH